MSPGVIADVSRPPTTIRFLEARTGWVVAFERHADEVIIEPERVDDLRC